MGKRIGIVMAGGSGERFWPLSLAVRPKQMLRLTRPDQTMLEEAFYRLEPTVDEVYLSTNAQLQTPLSESHLVSEDRLLAEPMRRDTLGALVWVVASLQARGETEATVAVVTADHYIGEPTRFQGTVSAALEAAELTQGLVTIGVTPVRPETGYGYIEREDDQTVILSTGRKAFAARSFREKPDAATAQTYLASGNFLWNAGMFFFTIAGFRRTLRETQPQADKILDAITTALREGQNDNATEAFAQLDSISFDYAVMEKAKIVHVVESDFRWDDVGAWDALERTLGTDDAQNVVIGKASVSESKGCVVYNDVPSMPVGVCGLENVVVVVTETGILVCRKEDAQKVREIGRAAQA